MNSLLRTANCALHWHKNPLRQRSVLRRVRAAAEKGTARDNRAYTSSAKGYEVTVRSSKQFDADAPRAPPRNRCQAAFPNYEAATATAGRCAPRVRLPTCSTLTVQLPTTNGRPQPSETISHPSARPPLMVPAIICQSVHSQVSAVISVQL